MTTWTYERDEELIRRRKAGETFKTIALAMGVTRNSVAGRCWRIGLTAPKKTRPATTRPSHSRPILDIAFEDLRE